MDQLRLDGAKSLVFYVNSFRSGSCLVEIDQNNKKIKCSIESLLSLVKSYPKFDYIASRLDTRYWIGTEPMMVERALTQHLNGCGWVEIWEELEELGGGEIPCPASSCSGSSYPPLIHPHTDSIYWGGAAGRVGNFRGVATRDSN